MRRTTLFIILVSSSILLIQGARSEHAICHSTTDIPNIQEKDKICEYTLLEDTRNLETEDDADTGADSQTMRSNHVDFRRQTVEDERAMVRKGSVPRAVRRSEVRKYESHREVNRIRSDRRKPEEIQRRVNRRLDRGERRMQMRCQRRRNSERRRSERRIVVHGRVQQKRNSDRKGEKIMFREHGRKTSTDRINGTPDRRTFDMTERAQTRNERDSYSERHQMRTLADRTRLTRNERTHKVNMDRESRIYDTRRNKLVTRRNDESLERRIVRSDRDDTKRQDRPLDRRQNGVSEQNNAVRRIERRESIELDRKSRVTKYERRNTARNSLQQRFPNARRVSSLSENRVRSFQDRNIVPSSRVRRITKVERTVILQNEHRTEERPTTRTSMERRNVERRIYDVFSEDRHARGHGSSVRRTDSQRGLLFTRRNLPQTDGRQGQGDLSGSAEIRNSKQFNQMNVFQPGARVQQRFGRERKIRNLRHASAERQRTLQMSDLGRKDRTQMNDRRVGVDQSRLNREADRRFRFGRLSENRIRDGVASGERRRQGTRDSSRVSVERLRVSQSTSKEIREMKLQVRWSDAGSQLTSQNKQQKDRRGIRNISRVTSPRLAKEISGAVRDASIFHRGQQRARRLQTMNIGAKKFKDIPAGQNIKRIESELFRKGAGRQTNKVRQTVVFWKKGVQNTKGLYDI